MQVSLITSTVNYFESPKAFRCWKTTKFYWLLLFSCTSLLITSDAVVAIATPQLVAQATPKGGISRPTLKVGSQGEWVSELQAALKLLGFYSGAVDGVYREETAKAVSRFKGAVDLSPDGIVDAITWQRLFPREPTVTPTISSDNSASNLTTNFPVPTQTSTNTRLVSPRPQPSPALPPSTPSIRSPGQIPGVQYTAQGLPILRLGMRNLEVRKLQQRLKKLGFLTGDVDGDFGVMTEAAVKAAQQRYGLEADGVVGGATWEALLRR
ncbi:peptidoglycan-binding domain-containing protein [Umezakia ovalisporum]|jgi:peptidoglycan hydrolase-like protein with peptidoglycan-binding domain|uniref:Peptidoglycan-binding protein n=2 Tax=Umezakia ovalisporum TaxID=75695 RepID=A0AA43H0L3_9CYAN|nr:peptidoglycan-binding protein [Umezakia ovalisporum]MBI1242893.1 peptidoglycan-binding protein [Nostoc sp. RI_552]MDH6055582.1 peptidoglycan-binding protein [Umezakia ovalisporum FSS-43]MDH6064727.1 peptidoglycan-binding protein [Umezakia ovalisporum FSS-62]MDH6066739.1 peptidoglycan-binding protein [Umezakia ovalisporum APH033B]MDH6069678.1 peptidoglycan-binding protein [Umezakia ovalisporum CobakiLakeA]